MTDEPRPTDDAAAASAPAPADADADAPDTRAAGDGPTGDGPTVNDYTVAFTPRNVAVGLAIVAGLIGLIVRRRRRRKGA